MNGRATHDLSPAHRVAISYSFNYRSSDSSNVGGLVLSEAGLNIRNRDDTVNFTDRIIVSPDLVQQLQIELDRETESDFSVTSAPSVQVQDAFTGGGAKGDSYRTENTVDIVAWTHGRHYVRFGVNMPQIGRRAMDDHTNRGGTFSFNSLADLSNATSYRFVVQQGTGRGIYVAAEVATFAQDEITLRKNLQVTVGLRYQGQTYLNNYGNAIPIPCHRVGTSTTFHRTSFANRRT